jgi:hypothetical protein
MLLTISQSCKTDQVAEKGELLSYYYLEYDIECCTELYLTENQVQYSNFITDSIYTLNYIFNKDSISADTITYLLKENKNFEPKYLINGKKKDHDIFLFANSKTFTIDKEYKVYKYASNPFVIDGCVTHFWTPEFGVILTRSTTWSSFRKLRTNNDRISRKIDLLVELIYQDTEFYKGCVEELKLIPKKDAEKYYKWKLQAAKIYTK